MAAVTSGSFNSYSSPDGLGNYNHYHVEWTSTSSSNKYTITVTITLAGDIAAYQRNCSNTTLTISAVSGCSVTPASRSVGVSDYIIVNQRVPNSSTSFTFTITQTGTTNLKFKLGINGTIGATLVSGEETFELAVLTTACGAPTSVSASGIIALGGSTTVSWQGASSGVNNTITGYTVYWRAGSAPTLSTYDGSKNVSSTSISGSTSLTIPNSIARGTTVYFGVQTKGSAGANYYSSIKTGGSIKINRLPSAPRLDNSIGATNMVNTTASTGAITAGSDSDSQTYSVYYATSTTGTKTKVSNSGMNGLNLGPSGTWYFWTYDGLEYSSLYTTFIVTQNVTPTLAINSSSIVTTTYTANGESGLTKNIQFFVSGTNLKPSTNNTLYTEIYYTRGSDPTWDREVYSYMITSSVSANSSGTISNIERNIRQSWARDAGLELDSLPICFIVRTRMYNGSGYSNWYYFGSKSHPTLYKYGRSPASTSLTLTPLNNSSSHSAVNTNFISKYVDVTWAIDTSLTSISFSATANGSAVSTPTIISHNLSNGTARLELPSNIQNGASVIISATISNGYYSGQISWEAKSKVSAPNMSNFLFPWSTVKPFTGNTTENISLDWPFGSDGSIPDKYAISNNYFKLQYRKGSNSVSKSLSVEKYGDSLRGAINESAIYGWSNELGIDTYVGTHTITVCAEITNLFGDVFTSNTQTFTLNFNEAVVEVGWQNSSTLLNNIRYSDSESGTYTNIGTKHVYEGLYLKFTYTISAYTRTTYTVELQQKIGGSDSTNSWKTVKQETITAGVETYNSGPAQHNFTLIYGEIPEVTDTSRAWRIQVHNAVNSSTKNNGAINTNMLRLTAPDLVINSLEYDTDTNAFNLNYTLTDRGYEGYQESGEGDYTTSRYLIYDESESYSSGDILEETNSTNPTKDHDFSDLYPSESWEAKQFRIRTWSRVYSDITESAKTKNFYTAYVTVYKIMPTVSYRKNYLGINTKTPESDAVVEIHTTQGRDSVYIINVTNNTIMAVISSSGGVIGGGSTII